MLVDFCRQAERCSNNLVTFLRLKDLLYLKTERWPYSLFVKSGGQHVAKLKQRSKDWRLSWPCMSPFPAHLHCSIMVRVSMNLLWVTQTPIRWRLGPSTWRHKSRASFWEHSGSPRASPEHGGPPASCDWANDSDILVRNDGSCGQPMAKQKKQQEGE